MPLPKFKFKEWFSDLNLSNCAFPYVFINLIVSAFEVLTYWLDIPTYNQRYLFVYVLIYLGFILPPLGLGILLLFGVRKKDLRKVWIWWLLEIVLLTLFLTLFIIGLYRITLKGVLNLFIYTLVRILGLKIIFDFMVTLNIESSISKIEPSKAAQDGFEIVSLDDPNNTNEKF